MNRKGRNLCLDICDYRNNFICNLYDSTQDLSGRATDVVVTTERNGWKELSFKLPSTCQGEDGEEENYRIQYLIADYRLRVKDDYETDWFLISEPKVTHSAFSKNIEVKATHVCQLLKTKNLNLEFSDSEGNNVGTAAQLLETILDGTGWHVGEVADFYEEDTPEPTIKVRSLEASAKTGAFRLIEMLCEKFDAKPVYHAESYPLLQEDPGDMDTNYSAYCTTSETGYVNRPSGPCVYIDGLYYSYVQLTEPTTYEDGKYFWYKVYSVDIMPMNPFSEELETGNIPNLVVSGDRKAIELHYEKNLKDVSRTLNTENIVTKLYAYGSYGDMNGMCSVQTAVHEEYQYVLTGSFAAGAEFQIKDDYGAFRYFIATDDLNAGDLLVWSKLDFTSRSYIWNDSTRKAYSLTKEPTSDYHIISDYAMRNQMVFTFLTDASTVTETYPEPRELTEEEQVMAQYETDTGYVNYKKQSELYIEANATRKEYLEKIWTRDWNNYYLSTLPSREVTQIHDFYFTDETNTTRYFTVTEDMVAGYSISWINSKEKIINNASGVEYDTTLIPIENAANLNLFAELDSESAGYEYSYAVKEMNYFPALLDFDYYEKIGLLDDEMKQAVAAYQRDMPEYYKISQEAAVQLANGLTELSTLANSQTGFLRIAISGYTEEEDKSVTMTIDTARGDNGVLYRSDYLEAKKNYFEWHIAKQLKANGDPVSGSPSALFIVHDTDPVSWERVYLKKIDDRMTEYGYPADYDYGLNMGDEPKKITVWGSLTSEEKGTIPPWSASDRFYLFCTVSTSGKLGALQAQDEAIIQQQITTSTAVSTEYHPFYFVDNRWTKEDGSLVEPPIDSVAVEYQYGWYYRFYPVEDRAGDLFYCGPKDKEWHPVYKGETLPETTNILTGDYFFNTKLRTLWILSEDENEVKKWVELESAEERRITTCFSQVWYLCRRRDQLHKGLYEKYEYTVGNVALKTGRYLIDSGYDYWWAFTTDRTIPIGSTIWVDTAYNYVYQDDDIANIVQANVVPQFTVKPMEANILSADLFSSGWLDEEDGHDINVDSTDTNSTRSKFIEVYPGNGYETNLPQAALIIFYDEAKRFRGFWQPANNSTFVVPEQNTPDYDSPEYKPDARFIRVAVPVDYKFPLGDTNGLTEEEWRATNPSAAEWLDENGFELFVEDHYDQSTNTTIAQFYTIINTPLSNYYIRLQGYETKAFINDNYKLPYTILSPVTTAGELKGLNNLTKMFADLSDTIYMEYLVNLRNAQTRITEEDNKLAQLLGDMMREGYWQETEYVEGDEAKLYRDALDNLKEIAHPEATYNISYLDLYGANMNMGFSADEEEPVEWPDIQITDAIHLVDPDIDINCWAYIDKIDKWYDQPWKTSIEINTKLSLIGQHDFTDVMTRIAEVASTAKTKQALLDRINEITNEEGYVYASKLIGEWEAKLKSTESSWYTDRHGNIVFEAADGTSAMMLTGSGYCISNRKDEWGDWVYTTMATGDGIAAEKIVAGYLNVQRIENYSITTEKLHSFVGADLDISANKTLTLFATADGLKPAGSLRSTDSVIEITAGAPGRPAEVNVASGGTVNLSAGAYDYQFNLVEEDPGDIAANYAFYYKQYTEDSRVIYKPLESSIDPATNQLYTFAENTFYTRSETLTRIGGAINIDSGGAINLNGGSLNMNADSNISIAAGAKLSLAAGSKFTVNSPNFVIDEHGNVEVRGDISAYSGMIAGFEIANEHIVYTDPNTGNNVYLGTDKLVVGDVVKTMNNAVASYANSSGGTAVGFYADRQGYVYMSGSINAYDGYIGGWRIVSSFLGGGKIDQNNPDSTTNYKVGMSSGTSSDTDVIFWAGRTASSTAFSVTAGGQVTINSGSITIKDNNVTTFSVDTTGYMTSTKGTIAGWTVGSYVEQVNNTDVTRQVIGNNANLSLATVGLMATTVDNNDNDKVIWAGGYRTASPKFYVTKGGALYSTNCSISGGSITIKDSNNNENFKVTSDGTLTAIKGSVGGWTIGSDYIGDAASYGDSTMGMRKTTSTNVVFWAGAKYSVGNAPFRVTAAGKLYASDINVTGGSMTIGSNFSVSSSGVTINGTLTAGTGSKIGNWSVQGNILRGSFTDNNITWTMDFDPSPTDYPIRIYSGNFNRFYLSKSGELFTSSVNAGTAKTDTLRLNDAQGLGSYADIQYVPITDTSITSVGDALKSMFNIAGYTGRETNIYLVRFRNRFMCYGMDYFNGSNSYKAFICIPSNESSSTNSMYNKIYIVKQVEGGNWQQAELSLTWTNI